MFGRTKKTNVVDELREAALRAIWRLEHPDGPKEDINPHTASITAYGLASMLTFTADGSARTGHADDVFEIASLIFRGKPEHREVRRDWAVWELERLGYTEEAQRFAREVDTHGGAKAV